MHRNRKATVAIRTDDDGTWLDLHTSDGTETISLSHSPAKHIETFFVENLPERSRPIRHLVGAWSRRAFAYTSGAFALIVVAASAVMASVYATTHSTETLNKFASSTISGIGIAIGGFMGSALILRFKSSRQFVRSLLHDLQ